MLHALLQGKLDASIPEPRRLEDAVTSTVFGTLLLTNQTGLLAAWLSTAVGASTQLFTGELQECWFWPRLTYAEPDVMLWIGDHLLIIEAKVRSGRHDLGDNGTEGCDDSLPLRDQLCRQWQSIDILKESAGVPAALVQAARQARPCLMYLVDERRLAKSKRELAESQALLPPSADVRLLTWQSLHRLLHERVRTGDRSRCTRDLLAYLELEGLAGFVGFGDSSFRLGKREAIAFFGLTQSVRQFIWPIGTRQLCRDIGPWTMRERRNRLTFLPHIHAHRPQSLQSGVRLLKLPRSQHASPSFHPGGKL